MGREIIRNSEKIKRIFAPGVFDLLHVGHVRYLESAKSLGNYLIVSVLTDKIVEKRKNRKPVFSLKERMKLLQGLKFVDKVVPRPFSILFDNEKAVNHILSLKIDCVVISSIYKEEQIIIPLVKSLKKRKIQIAFIPYTQGISTTKIIKSILENKPLDFSEIKSQSQTGTESQTFKKFNKVAFVPGIWDLFNVNHLNYLKSIKSRVDYLIAGVLSDKLSFFVKKIKPVINQELRIELLNALRWVDEVCLLDETLFQNENFEKYLKAKNVSVFFADFNTFNFIKSNNLVNLNKFLTHIYSKDPDLSSLEIIEKIKKGREFSLP